MASIEKTVFISYRRKDSYQALAVYQYLTGRKFDVFLDYTSIPSGDFEQIIVGNIKARAHFVLILTPTALDRCNEPGDWLRREIETAIDEKRNIIPLFFEDFNFGSPGIAEKLTGKLGMINRYNGLDVPAGYFTEAMERLCEKYLNVPLDAVIHPVPTDVQKVVQDVQSAANQALEQKKEDIDILFQPAGQKPPGTEEKPAKEEIVTPSTGGERSGKKVLNARLYGIGAGILLLVLLGIAGINSMIQNSKQPGTPTPTQTRKPALTPSPTQEISGGPVGTEFSPTPTAILPTGTATITPTPTPGIGSAMTSDKDSMTLLYVPAGKFDMGSEAGDPDESPVHTIELDAFWVDRTEITNEMYRRCVAENMCKAPSPKTSKNRIGEGYYDNIKYIDYPVINITWEDASAYCTWAGRRLPTEAEWEKAASWDETEQQKSIYPWGDSIDCSRANYYGGGAGNCSRIPDTTQVGSYPDGASVYGALDMAGNVWEWVYDKYDRTYYQDPSVSKNPQGPTTSANLRVVRGGSWNDFEDEVRSANRSSQNEMTRDSTLGFRCVVSE